MRTRALVPALTLAFAPALLVAQAPQAASATPPKLAAPKALTLPTLVQRTLPNGLKLIIVEQHELPIVDAALVVRTGSEADPNGKAGLATLTANMLDEGAGKRDALGLAEQIGYLAISLGTSAGMEQSTVSLHSTRATLDSAMGLMADVVLRPTFPDKEFDRLKSERLTALLQEQDRGPSLANRAYAALIYGEEHPYGRSTSGVKETAESLTRDDVVNFWKQWYLPNNATLVIVGDLSVADAEKLATNAFGGWARGPAVVAATYPTAASLRTPKATTIYVIDKPKAPQSSFRVGSVGVARSTTDYFPLMVMNTALGGSFTARLNNNLREQKGYTYGASSGFAMRRNAGPFTASSEVVAAKTDSALIEVMKELNNIRKPLPPAELAKTKRYLQLGYAERFETTGDIAGQIASLIPYNVPLSSLGTFNAGIGAVTGADVQRVANKYVDPSKLTIVIAGDRATIEPALKATKIAPVEVRDARGRPVITP